MLSIRKDSKGFTLIELMIVVAIIGILAAIAVPNFISYRNKSRVAACVSTASAIKGSFGNFAADSTGNSYPAGTAITDYGTLRSVCNNNGGALKSASEQGFETTVTYTPTVDSDGTTVTTYTLIMSVSGVPNTMTGYQIVITPGGISKQSGS